MHEQLSKNGPSTCGYSSPVPCDDVGHGTAITGTAVGDDHANNHIDVAPGATWIGCRDQDQGIGQPSMEIECYQFLTAPTDLTGGNPDPTRGADVINTSFTCKPSLPSCDPASLQLAIANLQTAGIFVTAAAGNEGPGCGTIQDPISWYPSVVAVGGTTDTSDDLASYSSRGPVTQDGSNRLAPLLVAPSQTISTTLGNGYQDWTGTSFSSPEVGGVVLLLWAAYPNLRGNLATTLTVLEESALKLAPPPDQLCGGDAINQVPNNATGYGRVDALSAYQVIVATPSPSDPRAYLPLVPGGSAVGW